MENIPFQILDQMIQCFGKCFYYKDVLESFLLAAGLNPIMARKYKNEHKFVWGRKLLQELNETEDGKIDQRKILTAFNKLRNLPDPNVIDKESGLSALRQLKELILEYNLVISEEKTVVISRKHIAEEKSKIILQRSEKLNELKNKFTKTITSIERQAAGFDLEDIIKELFTLFEIDYKKSYKTNTQQIDGYFKFDSFNYLVEAKWRKDLPNESEIGAFQRKVKTKLESTRGIFISMNGYREEVISQFNGHNCIILFCGIDLTYILEGRIDLLELLSIKIDKASQYGICYYPANKCV
jgi:hypothetical protein